MRLVSYLTPLLIVLVGFAAIPSMAQESAASVELKLLKVEGFVKGNRYVIDAAFSEQHNIPVPAPFEFIAPTADDHRIYTQPAPGGSGLFKLTFTTLEDQIKSNIQFVPMTVDMGPVETRLNSLQKLLQQAFIASVTDPDRAEINVTQRTQIGQYPAIESIGRYDGGADGLVMLQVVVIPNLDGVNGIVVIINGLTKNVPMEFVAGILTSTPRARHIQVSVATGQVKFTFFSH